MINTQEAIMFFFVNLSITEWRAGMIVNAIKRNKNPDKTYEQAKEWVLANEKLKINDFKTFIKRLKVITG